MNCLSVIQYAVEVLKIRHIIVCGHYGCGGVRAAMESRPLGLIDNWLSHIRDIYHRRQDELIPIADQEHRINRLCELNVEEQVKNVANTSIVQDAWRNGESLIIHGWIYGISDGLLKDLGFSVSSANELKDFKK
jgi:carbonic anhydrase